MRPPAFLSLNYSVDTGDQIQNHHQINEIAPVADAQTLTFGRYIAFQHLSQSTLPPSIWIHRPSSIVFSHRTHTRTFGGLFLCPAPSSRPVLIVGLVCERIGSFGGRDTLSRWASDASASGRVAGLCELLPVGESVPSSNSVSIARSRAPVDLAVVRVV